MPKERTEPTEPTAEQAADPGYQATETDSTGRAVDDVDRINLDDFTIETRRGQRIATHKVTGQRVQLPG